MSSSIQESYYSASAERFKDVQRDMQNSKISVYSVFKAGILLTPFVGVMLYVSGVLLKEAYTGRDRDGEKLTLSERVADGITGAGVLGAGGLLACIL